MLTPLRVRRSTAVLSLALALLAGGLIAVWGGHRLGLAASAAPAYVNSVSAQDAGSLSAGFAPIVKRAMPAVVNIASSRVTKTRGGENPLFNDPMFREFFGDQLPNGGGPRERKEHGLGSGVIVNQQGYILTNNHVVEKASEITVSLSDRREFKGKVVGSDPMSDLAVVKIDAGGSLPALPFSDSSNAMVGDIVLAIGNPFGIGQTVTMGIVSATSRGGLGIEDYEDFIQTDAAINPGNSGGALINHRGELVGINTAILAGRSGGNQGIGFAIPINMARQVMDQILKNGRVIRGYIGIGIQAVTPDLAKAFGMKDPNGVAITSVEPEGPAAGSGLQVGDVVTSLNGEDVKDINAFRLRVSQMAPGATVKLTVLHENGQKKEITVKLGELPTDKAQRGATPGEDNEGTTLAGVTVDRLTPQIIQRLGVPSTTRGVVITNIDPASNGAESGLQQGDVIQSINRQPVTSVADYSRLLRQAGKNAVLLRIARGQGSLFIVVQPD
ncbi:MAG: DegQ family serine endoprotease [Acidobacteria bacterium]|nr:DegQ family serine endoprotease [Acidobacteriota bacterium]